MIPAYAKEIVAARRAGKRPLGTVFVTDDWKIAEFWRSRGNAACVASEGKAYDWRFLTQLDVTIQSRSRMPQTGMAILEVEPRTLLVDCDLDEKPEWVIEPDRR